MKQETKNLPKIFEQLDQSVLSVIGSSAISGFQKAFLVATAIQELKESLTPEYMKPIMALQGSKLGFKTDKDKTSGYPIEQVRHCVVEAVLMGLQVTGNHFNIIAGNTYITKEGCGFLLNNTQGLSQTITLSLPRINPDKTSAAVDATIKWTLNGTPNEITIPIAVKMDSYTSVDAVIGKATRKARAWLLGAINGTEIPEGEIEDVGYTAVEKINPLQKIESAEATENVVGSTLFDSKK